MDVDDALVWAAERRNGVLITLRRDGRAQSSDIVYAVVDDEVRISGTADRAKTRNMTRDDRVVLHLSDPGSWSYLSFDGRVELTPVCTAPDDATADELVTLYEAVTGGPHPDWDEYRTAMVDEGRLVVHFRPTSVTGQIN
jgi:PPOX class probable F420-dependent enzyme